MSIRQLSKVSTALLVTVFFLSCSGVVNPPPLASGPTVSMVVPQSNGVATNRQIAVVFNQPMDPASINSGTFLVAGMTGTVTYDATNKIGGFTPSPSFAPNTAYNASITVGAKDMSGTPLAAPFNFSFTTRATSDTSAPNIVAVNLVAGATCVPLNQTILVTFDEQMDSLTINPSTFFIQGVAGAVTYNVTTQMATFTPAASLAAKTTYTIVVTSGATDMGGVPVAPLQQTFTTGPCQGGGPQPVVLCPNIGNFSVLAGTTVTNTGSTVVSGDVGVCPGTAVTGFPPGSTGGTIHLADGAASLAQATLTAAYIDAAGRAGGTSVAGDLVGQTLTAGVYTSTSSLAESGDLTLDAQGNPSAVFIFQIASTLTTGSGSHIVLANGAKACNVFWQVGSSATLGTNSVFNGNIMALTSISIATGVNLQGRALARNGAVTLDTDVITGCTCP
ncbi:MAG TPA: ice-binding family protein [Terriglobales bacterium]|nr:ice-binding family protein [Terriglobales bacterium]